MKRKKLKVELIPRHEGGKKTGPQTEPHLILDRLVELYHSHLTEARVAMVWKKGARSDKDGMFVLGQMKRASDMDKEMAPYDLVIILNQDAWANLSVAQREALVDHELCHAAVEVGALGMPKRDEKGRTLYRLRRHDLEEFRDVVRRHGLYLSDIEEFARAIAEAKKTPLFQPAERDEVQATVTFKGLPDRKAK